MDDAAGVTALAVGFMVMLPFLLFAVVRLEDTLANPPMRLRQRILSYVSGLWVRRR